MNKRYPKLIDAVLSSGVGLQLDEVLQLRNGSFDLEVTQEPSRENGYKRKESIVFHKPSVDELNQLQMFINGLNNGTITFSEYVR